MIRRFFRWQWLVASTLLIVIFWQTAILSSTLRDRVLLGAYDPAQAFAHAEQVAIEHHFVTWRLNSTSELENALQQSVSHQRMPMITLESWPWNWNGLTDETLLQDITAGRYDATLDQIFKVTQQYDYQTILFRWAHEMEMVGQYPWSKAAADDYIAAYRHVVDRGRAAGANNLLWMWSPAGNENAERYWPGDEYVDCMGVSIYAAKAWNLEDTNQLPSFSELMAQKYWLSARHDKPMLVAEVGVEGTPAEKEAWIASAFETLAEFPRINAWVYFNQRQPDIVPLDIGQVEWQLTSQVADYLAKQWQQTYPGIREKLLLPLSLSPA